MMKYITYEYGVKGRLPFVENFAGSSETGPAVTLDSYPERAVVELNSTPEKPNGVVIAGELGTVWELSYSVYKNGRWQEAKELREPDYSAVAKNGRFRYVMAEGVAVTFVKYDISSVAVSLTALEKLKIRLHFKPRYSEYAEMKLQMNTLFASAPEHAVIVGSRRRAEDFIVHEGRFGVEFGSDAVREYAALTVFGSKSNGSYDVGMNEATYEVALNKGSSKVTVFMRVGSEEKVKEVPSEEELIRGIGNAELEYTAQKAVGTGELAGKISEIHSGVYSHRAYDVLGMRSEYFPDKQAKHADLSFEPTAGALGVIACALSGDIDRDRAVLLAGEPAFGALQLWTSYVLSRDKTLLEEGYPGLTEAFSDDDKLVISDSVRREVAYKQPGSPMKVLGGEPVYSVEFSAYKLIATEIKALAARVLGKHDDAEKLDLRAAALAKSFNECFYDERLGLYMDRYISGGFTGVYGAASFLPLMTSAVNSHDILDALLFNLEDPDRFWSKAPVPNISVDHPAYGKPVFDKLSFTSPYMGFTGAALPGLNYVIYQGLVSKGADREAARFAEAMAKLYSEYFDRYGFVPDRLLPNGKIDQEGSRNSLSGNLIGLIGVQEVLDAEYFGNDLRPALRFGTRLQGRHSVSGVKFFGHSVQTESGEESVTLIVDGKKVFEAIGGSCKVRRFSESKEGVDFYIASDKSLTLTLNYPVFTSSAPNRILRFNLPAGRFRIVVKGSDFNYFSV